MMLIEVTCGNCGTTRSVGKDKAGLRLRCRGCGEIIPIPELDRPGAVRTSKAVANRSSQRTSTSPLAQLVRPVVYSLVGLCVIVGLLFRWWYNPPAPPQRTTQAVQEPRYPQHPPGSPLLNQNAGTPSVPMKSPSMPAPDDKLRSTLSEARAEMLQHGLSTKFESLLRGVVSDLPEIALSKTQEQLVWNKFTLYEHGVFLNAFRFTSPLDVPGDFFWCFVSPIQAGSWYILPAEGSMSGFRNFDSFSGMKYEGLDAPLDSTIIMQQLLGGQIAPGRTYIVYFNAAGTNPLPLHVAARVIPARHYHDHTRNYRRVQRALGLKCLDSIEATPGAISVTGHTDAILAMAWQPNGDLLSIGSDGTILQSNSSTGAVIAKHATSRIFSDAEISSDGRRALLLQASPPKLLVWDLAAQSPAMELPIDEGCVSVMFSDDGQNAYGAFVSFQDISRQSRIVKWNLESQTIEASEAGVNFLCKELSRVPGGLRGVGYAMKTDGGLIGAIADWPADLSSPPKISEFKGDRMESADRSPDGRRDIVCNYLGVLRVIDVESKEILCSCLLDTAMMVVRWLPDNRHVVVGGHDGTVRLFDTQEGQIRMKWQGQDDMVSLVLPSPDGQQIAAASIDGGIQLWDAAQRTNPDFQLETLVDSLGIVLKPIPGGEFQMGRSANYVEQSGSPHAAAWKQQESPQIRVRLSKPYYLSAQEITKGQFRQFVDATGYQTDAERGKVKCLAIEGTQRWYQPKDGLNWREPGYDQTDRHPVVNVTLEDAKAFCQWLSEKEKASYRLCSEAEWERAVGDLHNLQLPFLSDSRTLAYACNTGDQSLLRIGPQFFNLDDWDDGHAFTAEVGTYLPNMYGLSELFGNVWEMCDDAWTPDYRASVTEAGFVVDRRQSAAGLPFVERGSGFYHNAIGCRSFLRAKDEPGEARTDLGFRVLREAN